MKRFKIATVLLTFLVTTFLGTSIASASIIEDIGFETTSQYIYLGNLDAQTPIYTQNENEKAYPASLTKIMTYIVVVEQIEDLENTLVEVKQSVIDELLGTGSSLSGLENYVGEKLSVLDLLYCMMVSSGNDASLVLADYIGNGNSQNFVNLMNEKAKELGLVNTQYTNPHGLHDDNQYTTAKESYELTKYAVSSPKFMEICETTTHYIKGDTTKDPLITTNALLREDMPTYYYEYAKGIKTGTTDEAGFCLVSTAVKDNTAYLCVAMNAPNYDEEGNWNSVNGAQLDSKNLYEWAYGTLTLKKVVENDTPISEIDINYGQQDSIFVVPEYAYSEILPNDFQESSLKIVPDIQTTIDAPIEEGEILGTAQIYYNDELLKEINLISPKTVNRDDFSYNMDKVLNVLSSPWFLIIAGILITLFVVYLVFILRLKKSTKKK